MEAARHPFPVSSTARTISEQKAKVKMLRVGSASVCVFLSVLVAYFWGERKPWNDTKKIWRKQKREKIYDAICWMVLVPVMLFAVVWWILFRLFPDLMQLVSFIHSPYPWWIRVSAAIAVVAGLIYLFKKRRGTSPNQKFLD
jgi:hypothetical protein